MNAGQAHLENKSSADAVEAFARAVEIAASSAAHRNLARAHYLARDFEAVLAALGEAAKLEPESVATSYLTGLALARLGRFDKAVPHFEEAVRLDPTTAALRFQLANAYQVLRRHEKAVEQLRETVRLDPRHAGAHYKLSIHAQRAGDRREHEARHRDFQRLRRLLGDEGRTPDALERCAYTVAEAAPARRDAPQGIAVRFVEATAEQFPGSEDQAVLGSASAVAVVDLDASGRPSLLLAGEAGTAWLLRPAAGGGTLRKAVDLAPGLAAVTGIEVGDFWNPPPSAGRSYDPHRDARSDALLSFPGGVRLLLGPAEGGALDDVTGRAGLGAAAATRSRWIDYEADGDLDLAMATDSGLELWQNSGDGTFREVSEAVGLVGAGAVADLAVADLDGNVGLDLVAAGEGGTIVYENLRTGEFRRRPDPPGPWPGAHRVLLDDLDQDGRIDAVLATVSQLLILPGKGGERQHLDFGERAPGAIARFDFDNDGWLDLVAAPADGGTPRLWRNGGGGRWLEVTAACGLDGVSIAATREIVPVDLDADGDTDLLFVTAQGARLLRNDGGNGNAQLKVRLLGTKTNPSGLGTRVEVRRGDLWLTRSVDRLPVEIGLGSADPVDALRVVWTNGIVDNQLELPFDTKPVTVVEKNVAAGSCPFLYAWDGAGFRFVTDILGNSPLGLSLRRDVVLDADPDELVRIGGSQDLVSRDGAYVLQVTEEMREVLYLDQVRLVAADHPPGVEVHPTDKLMPAPFPSSELLAVGELRPPRRVLSDDGVERVAALATLDGDFAPPGAPLPPPLRGMTRPLSMIFDFGPLDVSRPLLLVLTGWLQYGDASTNIALSQGAAPVLPPRLEAETAAGFQPVDVVVGLPAGKTKTILVDLEGKLPPGACRLSPSGGTCRLRLTTSFEVRWDRIAIGEKLPAGAIEAHTLAPAAAGLFWRGFSEIRSRAAGHPTTPSHAVLFQRPPWRRSLEGWATRYGDVRELVAARDGQLALVAGGDAVELAFDAAALPAVAAGRERTFFFFSVGWDKDGDPNVIDGDRVEPLPREAEAPPPDEAWRLRFNTRWLARDRFASASP